MAVIPSVRRPFQPLYYKQAPNILLKKVEKIKTERYSYKDKEKFSNKLLIELEKLNNKQRIEAYEAIQKIKGDAEEEAVKAYEGWFEGAVLPFLKNYAENSFGELEIEREPGGIITASLKNSNGFELQAQDCLLRAAIFMAARITFEADGEEAVLTLTYDCHK